MWQPCRTTVLFGVRELEASSFVQGRVYSAAGVARGISIVRKAAWPLREARVGKPGVQRLPVELPGWLPASQAPRNPSQSAITRALAQPTLSRPAVIEYSLVQRGGIGGEDGRRLRALDGGTRVCGRGLDSWAGVTCRPANICGARVCGAYTAREFIRQTRELSSPVMSHLLAV
ncbi:hypothetical protein PR048_022591 [Dryococelus australis]|uniref:Uncharacterized protein n=1 Tax=Dryococelus australis TaxID=614101 RepID=A0ABQ9H1I6_9NEOP|nr:hypothetical protein PR048_022591 [Dryococelus australis]